MTTQTPVRPAARIYSGDEANDLVRNLARRRWEQTQAGDSVPTGIQFFDHTNPPLMRGDLGLIVGSTSEGKSLLATTMVGNAVRRLKEEGRADSAGVAVFLTEETVEGRRIDTYADPRVSLFRVLTRGVALDVIEENIVKTAHEPLYFIGNTSSGDVSVADDPTYGVLTVQRIAEATATLVNSGVRLELVVIDHVHDLAIENDRAGNEADTYDLIGRQIVRYAGWLSRYCPILLTAQANKEVQRRTPAERKPGKYDLAYMAAVARKARDIYSIWYPGRHLGRNGTVDITGRTVSASKGVFIVTSEKARHGEAGRSCAMTTMNASGEWVNYLTELPGGPNGK